MSETIKCNDASYIRVDALRKAINKSEKLALEFYESRSELKRENKLATDFVTEADRAVEGCIRKEILSAHPTDTVVGEELGGRFDSSYWLVDPIDGTSNFLSGLPLWAISIAYVENGQPTLGAISIPMLGRCLIGGRSLPLEDIGRNKCTPGEDSLVYGIGGNEFWPSQGRHLIEAELRGHGLVSVTLGSCATSLAFSATGELAGYAEGNIGFWDIAAGVALCNAAGKSVNYIGQPDCNQSYVSVSPKKIQESIYAVTRGCNISS